MVTVVAVSFTDVTSLVRGVIWPVVVLAILVAYRREIPKLFSSLQGRISRVSFGGASVEFVVASEAPRDMVSGVTEFIDATSAQGIISSDKGAALQRAINTTGTDYVKIDLRGGDGWLTTRLYIFSVILSESAQVKRLVFLERSAAGVETFIGVADPLAVAERLERRFAWLGYALAAAATPGAGTPISRVPQVRELVRPFSNKLRAGEVAENYLISPLIRNPPYPAVATQKLSQFTYTNGAQGAVPAVAAAAPYLTAATQLGHRVPVITGVSPPFGPPGTSVTITGSGFTGAREVRFGDDVASFAANSDTSITATAPPGVAPATVTVVTPAGSSTPAEDWVTLQGQTGQAYAEHASWIRNGEHLLALLGKVISRARVTETRSTKRTELRRMVLRQAGDFVAVVDEDNQFQRLIDRKAFVDRLARDTADDGQ